MKNMYVCEKCGKMFDSYEECYTHEMRHNASVELISEYELPDNCEIPVRKYDTEDTLPSHIFMKVPRIDDEGNYVRNKDAEDSDWYSPFEYDVCMYARVDMNRTERATCRALTQAIHDEQVIDYEERQARKAQEAAEQAAANADEEQSDAE